MDRLFPAALPYQDFTRAWFFRQHGSHGSIHI